MSDNEEKERSVNIKIKYPSNFSELSDDKIVDILKQRFEFFVEAHKECLERGITMNFTINTINQEIDIVDLQKIKRW